MKITVRQLKRLIKEAVEDASGEQLYDPSLGLQDVSTSREATNGTVSLLDPKTGDKYKITRASKYVRLNKPDWERKLGTYHHQPILVVSPKDVADDAEFVEYAYERITQYVNKRRASMAERQKVIQFDNDQWKAYEKASAARNTRDWTPEEWSLNDFTEPYTGKNKFKSPEYQAHLKKYVDYWKNQ